MTQKHPLLMPRQWDCTDWWCGKLFHDAAQEENWWKGDGWEQKNPRPENPAGDEHLSNFREIRI
ncbi:hypothetical protein [Desulfobulbus elongatus]|uniref:hypothetical protein n=1 Tax=Desulfobulbus elongatus TaxID=53332 RepID=UPI0012FA217A|nr:hypothetical protein [Desulfobulbus elongatus]